MQHGNQARIIIMRAPLLVRARLTEDGGTAPASSSSSWSAAEGSAEAGSEARLRPVEAAKQGAAMPAALGAGDEK